MRALVTGGHGFVGSHLVDRLQADGVTVRCLSRRERVPDFLARRRVEVAAGDIRQPLTLRPALEGVDEVYHLAALTRSLTRDEMLSSNGGGTENLLRAAVEVGLPGRFLYCSSLAAVGPSLDGKPVTEASPCRPVTWYGESKLAGETATHCLADRLATSIVRPPAVYGPRDRDFQAVFRAARRGILPVLGDRPHLYSFVFAPDLARALVEVARSPATVGCTYFAAHPEILSVEEFLNRVALAVERPGRRMRVPDAALRLAASAGELVAQLSGRAPLINRQRLRELEGEAYVCSAAALERDIGWVAAVDAREGAALTASWYRDHGWL